MTNHPSTVSLQSFDSCSLRTEMMNEEAFRIVPKKYACPLDNIFNGGGSLKTNGRDHTKKLLTNFKGAPTIAQFCFSKKAAWLEAKIPDLFSTGKFEPRIGATLQLSSLRTLIITSTKDFAALGFDKEEYLNQNWRQLCEQGKCPIGAMILELVLRHNLLVKQNRTADQSSLIQAIRMPSAAAQPEEKLILLCKEVKAEREVTVRTVEDLIINSEEPNWK